MLFYGIVVCILITIKKKTFSKRFDMFCLYSPLYDIILAILKFVYI